MNQVATKTNTQVANQQNSNYFTQYGDQVAQRTIVGTLLKFSKGDYLAGEANEDVPTGSRFVVKMDDFMIGWQCWKDNKPTDTQMGRLGEGFQPPKRHELGDDDQDKWEKDEATGELRDPWQFSNAVPFKMVDEQNAPVVDEGDDGDVYTFVTSSRGGINALGLLSQKYGKAMRQHPDEWPVIEIDVDSYQHKNKSFGRIKFPVFNLVGWVPKERFVLDTDNFEAEQQTLPLNETGKEKPPTKGARF